MYLFEKNIFCGRRVFIFYQNFDYPKIGKTHHFVILGSDTHISDAKTNPFITFGLGIFTYLNHIWVQIKEKLTCKNASNFLLFGKNTGPKKSVCEPSPKILPWSAGLLEGLWK